MTMRTLLAASALITASPAHAGIHEAEIKALPKPITQNVGSLLGDGQKPYRVWDTPPLPLLQDVPEPVNQTADRLADAWER